MSNIGKQSITIPDNTEIKISSNNISVKGKLGQLDLNFNSLIKISEKDNLITLSRSSDKRECRELHGLYRALVQNMVVGVNEGFSKELNLVGVGYTSEKKGNFLLINAGYSHPIYFQIPDGIDVTLPDNTTIIIKGINKQNVGDVAAKIRQIRKPEPYKGKGIKYSGEHIRRKAGKTVGAPGA
jgi:large subunit ribosomal protein L6